MRLTLKARFVRMLTATGHTKIKTQSYLRDIYTNGEVWYFLSSRGVRRNLNNDKITESHNFLQRMQAKLNERESKNAEDI